MPFFILPTPGNLKFSNGFLILGNEKLFLSKYSPESANSSGMSSISFPDRISIKTFPYSSWVVKLVLFSILSACC